VWNRVRHTATRTSITRWNGVSAALRSDLNPACSTTARIRAGPACVPSASPTACDNEAGVQSRVEKP